MSRATHGLRRASRIFGSGSRRLPGAAALAGAAAAVLVAGCGSGTHARTSSQTTTSAAGGPPRVKISAALRKQEAALHREVTASLRQQNGGHGQAIPVDLRSRQKPPPVQVIPSSQARPADPIQGVQTRLRLGGATALAVAVGPYVPTAEQGTFDLHTPAHWTVTFSDVHGRFPLSSRMFTLTDQQGEELQPRVTVSGGGRLPATVPAGRPFTVLLTSDLVSEGDGKLRYAPVDGHLLVEWDFDVETD